MAANRVALFLAVLAAVLWSPPLTIKVHVLLEPVAAGQTA